MGILGFVFIRSGWWLVLGAVLGVLVFRNTTDFRARTGVSPWGVPPFVWGLVTVFVTLIGTVLSLIAMRTTRVPAQRLRMPSPVGSDHPAFWAGSTAVGGGRPPPKPSWHPDPAGRHQLRYWDGDSWTEHVSNDGTPAQDPL